MRSLAKLARCDGCGSDLRATDVDNVINATPGYVYAVYVCPYCAFHMHVMYEADDLRSKLRNERSVLNESDLIAKVFAFDMETIDTVEDFLAHAGSRNVPVERLESKCGCKECTRRG